MSIKQDYHDKFRFNLLNKKTAQNLPLKGALELTYKCNLRCRHCYAQANFKNNEMSFEQIDKLLKEIRLAGCFWLLITGGEPLSRPDFIKIYFKIKEYGFLPVIFTNAALINEKIAKVFAEYRPLVIEVSLYALGEKKYKEITRVRGAYKKCRKGIDLLIKYKIPFRIKMPLMSLNIGELDKVKKYAKKLKVPFRCDAVMHSCLNGSTKPIDFSLSLEEIAKLSMGCQGVNHWLEKKNFLYYTCGAGLNFFSIDPHGKLKACMLSAYPSYDVLAKSFISGWEKYFKNGKVFKTNVKRIKNCLDCNRISFCDICPGWWKDKEGKDRFKPQDYLCSIADLRYQQAKLSKK